MSTAAHHFDAARSSSNLRYLALVLAAIGLFVSSYLSYVELTDTSAICVENGAFNCDLVQKSIYSEILGIKIAYLGVVTYLALGALLVAEARVALLREYGPVLIFGITLFGFLYSVWLVYVQAFRLEAFCPWCLAQEAAMTLLFFVSILRLRKSLGSD
ncbi:MAG: vitamin K epoxide reductase family protein [Anaerolineaceae bacterium]|nr:vitamin K epoxide reductase family protein [Anaerolineaceae bacterium]